MSRFKRWDAHGFTYIFGDEILFCDQTCREMDIENHIAQTLIENKYDLVLIYDKANGFRYPKGSEQKMDDVYEKIIGTKFFPVQGSTSSSASPLLRGRGNPFKNSNAQSPKNQSVTTESRRVWDSDVMSTFDTILRRPRKTSELEKLRAAIVMMNMRSFLDICHKTESDINSFNAFFDRYKTRMGDDAFILCFNGYTPQTARIQHEASSTAKYLTEWYQNINENSGVNANILVIGTPPQAEVRNFLNRRRLIGQLKIPVSQLDELTEKIFRLTRSEKMSLATLGVRINDWQRLHGSTSIIFNRDTFSNVIGIECHDKTSKQMLDELVGLTSIREELKGIEYHVKNKSVSKKSFPYRPRFFESNNESKPNLKLHFALKGNPGTGKTTVAELLGRYLYEIGALTSGHVVKCVANDLMADHVGGTAIKASARVNEALGGVLFIDEISAIAGKRDVLNNNSGSHGFAKELNSVLLNAMTSYSDLSIVIAGYPDDVDSFIASDNGFSRRFTNIIKLPDYDAKELAEIFRRKAKSESYSIEGSLEEKLVDFMHNWLMQKPGDNTWGNAGEVENLILKIGRKIGLDKIIREKDIPQRIIVGKNEYNLEECIINCGSNVPSPTQKLDALIGLEGVKNKIANIQNLIKYNRARGKESRPSLNFVFSGNPGTGKTTVAKIFGEMLAKIGVLQKSTVVEVTREDLVGSYLGLSEAITKNVFHSAIGGVLFIDEAYSLSGKGGNDYGRNVIESLVKFSDEYRGQVCIILAGYTAPMKAFLRSNSGLNSRFMTANQIEFEDYSPKDLFLIFKHFCKENDYCVSDDFDDFLMKCIHIIVDSIRDDFGNGREMRNLYENCEYALSARLMKANTISNEFIVSDLVYAMQMMKMPVPAEHEEAATEKIFPSKESLTKIIQDSDNVQYNAEALEEAVIFITTDKQSCGSGFIITDDGYAVTCAHVIKDMTSITARVRIKDRRGTNHDREYDCTVIASDERHDVALLKLNTTNNTPHAPLLPESQKIDKGADIHLLGYPFGNRFDNLSVFKGNISSSQTTDDVESMLLNIEGKHGCSGGMCVDPATGYVVGIFSGSYTRQSDELTEELQYARPVKYIWDMIPKSEESNE